VNRFRLEGEMVMSIVVGRRLVVVISSRVVGSAADGHGRRRPLMKMAGR